MLVRLGNLIIGHKKEVKAVYKSMLRNGIRKDIIFPNDYFFPDFTQDKIYAIYISKDTDIFYLLNTSELTSYMLTGSF